jgi:hypothetical protein
LNGYFYFGGISKMSFEKEYQIFMEKHIKVSNGERLKKLKDHGEAEVLFLQKVWWPMFGNFDDLHPEYEVTDFKDGKRYIDFAYILSRHKLALEILGYHLHCRDLTRWEFSDSCTRHNHLLIDVWLTVYFSYDQVNGKSRMCEQILHQAMLKLLNRKIQEDGLYGEGDRTIG